MSSSYHFFWQVSAFLSTSWFTLFFVCTAALVSVLALLQLFLRKVRDISLRSCPSLFLISFNYLFIFALRIKSIILTEASPKTKSLIKSPLYQQFVQFSHCALVTLATFQFLWHTELAPPGGSLHLMYLLKGHISLLLFASLPVPGSLGLA